MCSMVDRLRICGIVVMFQFDVSFFLERCLIVEGYNLDEVGVFCHV